MYTTTTKTSKPMIITGRAILAATRLPYKFSFRCETHGKKGKKTRADVSRRAIREQC
jgi:hypothetical protein